MATPSLKMSVNPIGPLPQHGDRSSVPTPIVGIPRPLLIAREAARVCARREEAQVHRTHTAGIEKLPLEVMSWVLKDLNPKDVLNLRSTSRTMQAMTWTHTAKHCFSTIRVPLTEEGHDRVATLVAEDKNFRDSFTKVVFEAGVHIPSDADNVKPTRKERSKLDKAAKKAQKAIQIRKKELKLAAERQALRHEAVGTAPDAGHTPTPVVQDPDYIKPRKWHRGRSLPTSSQKNAEMHKGRLYGALVIRKSLELLPSITDITIFHNVAGVKQRDRHLWVRDHCVASAETESLLVALAEHPMPKLKRLHMASSCFERNWHEGLIMLSNLHHIPAKKLAALAPTLANLEHFGLSVNTNTLDGVSDAAYASVSRLLHMMPNLTSLELAVSKRSRKVYPTQLFHEILTNVPRLRKLEHLTVREWPMEEPAFKCFLRNHRATLQTLTLDRIRVFNSFTPGAENMPNGVEWPTLIEEMKGKTLLRVVDEMELECRDMALARKLTMRRETAEEIEEEKMKKDEKATEDEDMVDV